MTIRVHSNITEIGEFETLPEALALAISQAYEYDDIVRIEENGVTTHFAQYGALYRAALDPSNGAPHPLGIDGE
jgi:hypothetical protein